MNQNSAVIISGPTGSGKSKLALSLAEIRDIVIINADSLQVYQGLPILSAQPNLEEVKLVTHLLYSHFAPQEKCSVAIWLELVRIEINQAFQAKKLPVIVGGTGMYISKMIDGISPIPLVSAENLGKAEEFFLELGKEALQAKLQEIGEALIIDKQRLVRAYSVFLESGRTLSWWQKQANHNNFADINFIHVNLDCDLVSGGREKLYQNCNRRFQEMLKIGAIDEVKNLVESGCNDDWQISKTLGFAEIRDFLFGRISQEKMIDLASQKTRNYAKRQLTWFRHQFLTGNLDKFPEDLGKKLVFSDAKKALDFLRSKAFLNSLS